MSTIPSSLPHESNDAWEVATLFPEQGEWTEAEYLSLTNETNRRIELNQRKLELPNSVGIYRPSIVT